MDSDLKTAATMKQPLILEKIGQLFTEAYNYNEKLEILKSIANSLQSVPTGPDKVDSKKEAGTEDIITRLDKMISLFRNQNTEFSETTERLRSIIGIQ